MEGIFSDEFEKALDTIAGKGIAVLATSADDRVSARAMSFVRVGNSLWFQTDDRFDKADHMRRNPNVALCLDNIQLEGTVVNHGHSSVPGNEEFVRHYAEKHPGSFKMYTAGAYNCIMEIEPRLITLWRYREGQSRRVVLDVERHMCSTVPYDPVLPDASRS